MYPNTALLHCTYGSVYMLLSSLPHHQFLYSCLHYRDHQISELHKKKAVSSSIYSSNVNVTFIFWTSTQMRGPSHHLNYEVLTFWYQSADTSQHSLLVARDSLQECAKEDTYNIFISKTWLSIGPLIVWLQLYFWFPHSWFLS